MYKAFLSRDTDLGKSQAWRRVCHRWQSYCFRHLKVIVFRKLRPFPAEHFSRWSSQVSIQELVHEQQNDVLRFFLNLTEPIFPKSRDWCTHSFGC